jgi:hypothetical protein
VFLQIHGLQFNISFTCGGSLNWNKNNPLENGNSNISGNLEATHMLSTAASNSVDLGKLVKACN